MIFCKIGYIYGKILRFTLWASDIINIWLNKSYGYGFFSYCKLFYVYGWKDVKYERSELIV